MNKSIIKSKFLSLEPAPMGSHCFLMPVSERVTGWAHPDLPAASMEPLSLSSEHRAGTMRGTEDNPPVSNTNVLS